MIESKWVPMPPPGSKTRTCASCDHWAVYPSKRVGECRRHAPAPMYSLTGDKPGPIWWPQTEGAFWCGDYAERASEVRSAGNLLVPLKPEKFSQKIRKKNLKIEQEGNIIETK